MNTLNAEQTFIAAYIADAMAADPDLWYDDAEYFAECAWDREHPEVKEVKKTMVYFNGYWVTAESLVVQVKETHTFVYFNGGWVTAESLTKTGSWVDCTGNIKVNGVAVFGKFEEYHPEPSTKSIMESMAEAVASGDCEDWVKKLMIGKGFESASDLSVSTSLPLGEQPQVSPKAAWIAKRVLEMYDECSYYFENAEYFAEQEYYKQHPESSEPKNWV